jgi:predicted TIM-barrel fold metal-dependent hydrolase
MRSVIDTHVHFWRLEPIGDHPWIPEAARENPSAAFLGHDFMPVDFVRAAAGVDVRAFVHIEAGWKGNEKKSETLWVRRIVEEAPFPCALVVGAALEHPGVRDDLLWQKSCGGAVGVRQMLDWDPVPGASQPPCLLGSPEWERGLRILGDLGLVFEVQASPDQLPYVVSLVSRFPEVTFVLDHGGLRAPRTPEVEELWRTAVANMALHSNVRVKVSGYGAVDATWQAAGFKDYVNWLVDLFGPGRSMFGSNFPFDSATITYVDLVSLHEWALERLNSRELDQYFLQTAADLYGLPLRA